MARDVTWRSRTRPHETKQHRLRWGILGVLIAVNIGVFLYHGDPRSRMPQRPAEPKSGTPRSGPHQTPTGAQPRTELETPRHETLAQNGIAAVTDPTTSPVVAPTLDPTAGMRTPATVQHVVNVALRPGQTVAAALGKAGARSEDVTAALDSLKGVVDFRRLHPGNSLTARFDVTHKLVGLDVQIGPTERARAHVTSQGWQGHPLDVAVDTVVTKVVGEVRSSLWEALTGAGERPWLVTEMVDMFAWDIDFYTEVYPGDSFKVLVEKRYLDGDFVGYGALLAGEFTTHDVTHRAFRFQAEGSGAAYYDEAGRSLRKQLLRSPLQYGNVTSGFGMRKHPILGYTRAHNGIDYGVPVGSPVWAVGDGHVVRAGWDNGFGKVIEVRHPNGWVSQYGHLSRIDVKVGEHVTQKEFIGKTGSTGMSTGPHLHYGLKRNGAYVNPADQKFERGKSLEGVELERYKALIDKLRPELEQVSVAHESKARGVKEG